MPILDREKDIYPDDLFDRPELGRESGVGWWALYTLSRREKQLMRQLPVLDVPFFTPIVSRRNRRKKWDVRELLRRRVGQNAHTVRSSSSSDAGKTEGPVDSARNTKFEKGDVCHPKERSPRRRLADSSPCCLAVSDQLSAISSQLSGSKGQNLPILFADR